MNETFDTLDAFLALNELDDEDVSTMLKKDKNLTEGKAFSIYSNGTDLEEAKDLLNEDPEDVELEVIDPDADSLEHLKDKKDYIGQIILRCNRCKANHFIDIDKLVASDDPEVFNAEDECPHCHASGDGFEQIGQVGKVADEEPAEEVSVENDLTDSDEAVFDNDLEDEKVEADADEEAADEATDDISDDDLAALDDEDDGLDTETSEDELDDLDIPTLGDEVEEKIPDEDIEDEEEHVKESLNETYKFENELAEKAWMMNRIISHMNNEEAYYGGWLYIWPDGETPEVCEYDFGDPESFDDLEKSFTRNYTRYHADGLYEAPEDVVNAAHEWDIKLGLAPIENLKRAPKPVREALKTNTVNDFLALFTDPESIDTFVVYNNVDDKSDVAYQGSVDELSDEILMSDIGTFNVADGYLNINIDSEGTEGTTLEEVLELFDDEFTDNIILWDEEIGDTAFQGSKDEAIAGFGKARFISIEAPERVEINISNDDVITEEVSNKVEATLFEQICKANDLSAYRVNNPKHDEYWINEALGNPEDLDYIYRTYILPINDAKLTERFKKETGYKDIVDEAYEKLHGEDNHGELDFNPDDFANDDRDAHEKDPAEFLYDLEEDYTSDEMAEIKKLCAQFGVETKEDLIKLCGEPRDRHDPLTALRALQHKLGKSFKIAESIQTMEACGFTEWYEGLTDADRAAVDALADKMGYPPYEDCVDEDLFALEDAFAGLNNAISEAAESDPKVSNVCPECGKEVCECNKITEDVCPECGKTPCECKHDAEVRSFKSRKDLSAAIEECKNNNRPYSVKRSVTEGYRYDLILEAVEDVQINEAKKDDELDKVTDSMEKIETVIDLVQDEVDAVDGYTDAIETIDDSKIPNKEEIISKLHHIKGEELEHIDELKEVEAMMPDVGELAEEPEFTEEPEAVEEVPEEVEPAADVDLEMPAAEELPVEEAPVEENLEESVEEPVDALKKEGFEISSIADLDPELDAEIIDYMNKEGLQLLVSNPSWARFFYFRNFDSLNDFLKNGGKFSIEDHGKILGEAVENNIEPYIEDESEEDEKVTVEPIPAEVTPESHEDAVEIENEDSVEEIAADMEDVEFEGELNIKPVEVADGAHEVEEISIEQTEDGVEVEIKADSEPMEASEEVEEAPAEESEATEEEPEETEMDFDADKFDADINDYLDEAYEDTMHYRSVSGTFDDSGNIVLEGMIANEDGVEHAVKFFLAPNEALGEELNTKSYKVTNDLSDEVLEFNF